MRINNNLNANKGLYVTDNVEALEFKYLYRNGSDTN